MCTKLLHTDCVDLKQYNHVSSYSNQIFLLVIGDLKFKHIEWFKNQFTYEIFKRNKEKISYADQITIIFVFIVSKQLFNNVALLF